MLLGDRKSSTPFRDVEPIRVGDVLSTPPLFEQKESCLRGLSIFSYLYMYLYIPRKVIYTGFIEML